MTVNLTGQNFKNNVGVTESFEKEQFSLEERERRFKIMGAVAALFLILALLAVVAVELPLLATLLPLSPLVVPILLGTIGGIVVASVGIACIASLYTIGWREPVRNRQNLGTLSIPCPSNESSSLSADDQYQEIRKLSEKFKNNKNIITSEGMKKTQFYQAAGEFLTEVILKTGADHSAYDAHNSAARLNTIKEELLQMQNKINEQNPVAGVYIVFSRKGGKVTATQVQKSGEPVISDLSENYSTYTSNLDNMAAIVDDAFILQLAFEQGVRQAHQPNSAG